MARGNRKEFFQQNKAAVIAGVIALVFIAMVVGSYNNFVSLGQSVNSRWSEVNNQYQRQADLIPNLVSTVGSAVRVETKFVTDVTEARSRWQASRTLLDKDAAGVQMANGIAALINAVATSENYPVLQANRQYVALTDELTGTQNRIAVARGRYIDGVRQYNTAVKTFPGNLFASAFGFGEKEYYQAPAGTATPQLGAGQLP